MEMWKMKESCFFASSADYQIFGKNCQNHNSSEKGQNAAKRWKKKINKHYVTKDQFRKRKECDRTNSWWTNKNVSICRACLWILSKRWENVPGSVNFEQKIGENLANTLANFFRAKGADWLPFSRKAPNFSKPSANGESAEEFLELWTWDLASKSANCVT